MPPRKAPYFFRLATAICALAACLALLAAPGETPLQTRTAIAFGAVENLPAAAAPPAMFNYQGRLLDPVTGLPKRDGVYRMTFNLYDTEILGVPLWTEAKDIGVSGGVFSTLLGDTKPLDPDIFDGRPFWLGVSVGTDPEAEPRMPIAYVPYALHASHAGNAFYAGNADMLDGQHAAAFAATTHNHDIAYVNDNTNEIGNSDVPDGALTPAKIAGTAWTATNDGPGSGLNADFLDGLSSASFANASHPHFGVTWSGSNGTKGLIVENTGSGDGLHGISASANVYYSGVYGYCNATGTGVFGRSASGRGVFGESLGTGPGVYGTSTTGVGVYGVDGGANTDNSYALYAQGDIYTTDDMSIQDALNVGGLATFSGGKSGFVVDVAQNDDTVPLEAGDVVAISGAGPAVLGEIPVIKVRRATAATPGAVMGVVDQHFVPAPPVTAGEPGIKAEHQVNAKAAEPREYITVVILGAYKGIKVDATQGAIAPGDLLVAAPRPGYAMRATAPTPGTIIGKALGSLADGAGIVPVLVTLQ